MTTLVIVESPAKAKKIGAYLGPAYKVLASYGHIRDLPENDIAVSAPTYRPKYVSTGRSKDVIKRIKDAAAVAGHVLLATDPDREGEAIAWHLAAVLKLANPTRVVFSEITEREIKAAIGRPRPLDMHLVHGQEARRVVDRFVGYQVSPLLSTMAGQARTAGRVQSPTVRLIVDLERRIRTFVSVEHYGVELTFSLPGGGRWSAAWNVKSHLSAGSEHLLDRVLAERAAGARDLAVLDCVPSVTRAPPPAPFTTSTLLQAAQQRLGMKAKTTMAVAQRLFEHLEAITYHRTDRPNLSDDAFHGLQQLWGSPARPFPGELVSAKRTWEAKAGAQEAHEAIRPVSFAVVNAGESDDEKALYQLIWSRAVASQMGDAVYNVRTVTLAGTADSEISGGLPVTFTAKGRTLAELGWKVLYAADTGIEDGEAEANASAAANPVPDLEAGTPLDAAEARVLLLATKAPSRFKEGTLTAELERQGIGRPSTYASLLTTIVSRGYVEEDKSDFFVPREAGEALIDSLVGRFQFVELDYTRKLEDRLDEIAAGNVSYLAVVGEVHDHLAREIAAVSGAGKAVAHPCPACGAGLIRRPGKKAGTFWWGCSAYPSCKCTLDDTDGTPVARNPQVAAPDPASGVTAHHCPKCSKPLAHRKGIGQKGPYDFFGCTGFPSCKASYRTAPDGSPIFPV